MIDADGCAELRERHRNGETTATLADEFAVSEATVSFHLKGECGHDSAGDSVSGSAANSLSEDKCFELRERAASDRSARQIAEQTGHSFSTVVSHLSGECDHERGPTFEQASIFERINVSAEECARLRREYDDDQPVKSFAATVPWTYHTVLTHLNGQCDHDVDVEPREMRDRTEVDAERCRQFRATYREDSSLTIEDVADRYDIAPRTAETHLKYGCSHPPREEIQQILETAGLEAETATVDSPSERDASSTDSTARTAVGSTVGESAAQQTGGDPPSSPPDENGASTPPPRIAIVGDLHELDRDAVEARLDDHGWRVADSPAQADELVLVGAEADVDEVAVEVEDVPVVEEAAFPEQVDWIDAETTDSLETDPDSTTQPTMSDNQEDRETYRVSPLAARAVRRAATDPNHEAETESDVIRTAVKSHIIQTVQEWNPDQTTVPEPSVQFQVDLEPQNKTYVDGISGEDRDYDAPSAFVEEAIRTELEMPDADPTEVTIPGETAARIEAAVETTDRAESVDEFVLDIVEQAVDDQL